MTGTGIDVGMMVADKYLVLESLGRGGMSNVWLARDERLGKLWAIKEIKPNVRGTQGRAMRKALVDEANFMKRLDHPAIPRIVDIIDTGATTFVVMDYVDGRSLSDLMAMRGRPFDQQDVLSWGLSLCDVLAYLHNHRPMIVYRDLKPANVMVREDGSVRLIDFGIAWVREDDRPYEGRLVGTPGYAPPEQIPLALSWPSGETGARGQAIDGRSDVYSLGTTLYTLVTGHVPQRTKDAEGRLRVSFDMRPIREWNPRLSEGLERIILRATMTDPDDRYQRIEEMRYDLEHHDELTRAWRADRERTMRTFGRLVASTGTLAVAGMLCLALSSVVRQSNYAELMYEASLASRQSLDYESSDAERLYVEAMALSPTSIEPYQRLLDVYVSDYRLTDAEELRWARTFAAAKGISDDPQYAQLCFDVGTCYLSYYGIDVSGGSVGNVAVASIGSASDWFDRALRASQDEDVLSPADRRAAETYQTIARFYESVTRAGREGRAASDEYLAFWRALETCLTRETEARGAERSAEGVRVRLCQVGVESLASSTYLTGFARSGVTQEQARQMIELVSACTAELGPFAEAPEYSEVYGPVFQEIREGLALAEQNVLNTYENPVATVLVAGEEA